MSARTELAPGVPEDYYRRIDEAEQAHSWYRAMWAISAALLGERMRTNARALDAGCGTGGYLRFLLDRGRFSSVAGTDIAGAAVELAQERVPEANLHVAPLRDLPFPDASFELVVSHDVLQHVPEVDVHTSLLELQRVLVEGGTLLIRTNGARRLRRERDDWRVYDRRTLTALLTHAGFQVTLVTYANMLPSLVAAARGRFPHAPTDQRHGIPAISGRLATVTSELVLGTEAWWIGAGRTLPYGHTLFALSVRT